MVFLKFFRALDFFFILPFIKHEIDLIQTSDHVENVLSGIMASNY